MATAPFPAPAKMATTLLPAPAPLAEDVGMVPYRHHRPPAFPPLFSYWVSLYAVRVLSENGDVLPISGSHKMAATRLPAPAPPADDV